MAIILKIKNRHIIFKGLLFVSVMLFFSCKNGKKFDHSNYLSLINSLNPLVVNFALQDSLACIQFEKKPNKSNTLLFVTSYTSAPNILSLFEFDYEPGIEMDTSSFWLGKNKVSGPSLKYIFSQFKIDGNSFFTMLSLMIKINVTSISKPRDSDYTVFSLRGLDTKLIYVKSGNRPDDAFAQIDSLGMNWWTYRGNGF